MDWHNDHQIVAKDKLPWPDTFPHGFANTPSNQTVEVGTILDRFGDADGYYLSEVGATIAQRGMPPGSEALPYTRYEVLKPFDAQVGPAAGVPEFSATGGAIQYYSSEDVQWLLDNEYLAVIND